MNRVLICLAAASLMLSGQASAEIYKYIDENGQVTFTDVQRKGVKASKVYDLPAGPAKSRRGTTKSVRKTSSHRPEGFPRIDPATQRKRDDIRHRVLQEELDSERKSLEEADKQLSIGSRLMTGERPTDASYLTRVKRLQDAVDRHQSNIIAIQKELDSSR
jgi:hypothetical protein